MYGLDTTADVHKPNKKVEIISLIPGLFSKKIRQERRKPLNLYFYYQTSTVNTPYLRGNCFPILPQRLRLT